MSIVLLSLSLGGWSMPKNARKEKGHLVPA